MNTRTLNLSVKYVQVHSKSIEMVLPKSGEEKNKNPPLEFILIWNKVLRKIAIVTEFS